MTSPLYSKGCSNNLSPAPEDSLEDMPSPIMERELTCFEKVSSISKRIRGGGPVGSEGVEWKYPVCKTIVLTLKGTYLYCYSDYPRQKGRLWTFPSRFLRTPLRNSVTLKGVSPHEFSKKKSRLSGKLMLKVVRFVTC